MVQHGALSPPGPAHLTYGVEKEEKGSVTIQFFWKYLGNQGIDYTHVRPHHLQILGKVEALSKRIRHELFSQDFFSTLKQALSVLTK